MPHLPLMQWDFRDQLQATARQVVSNGGTPEMTWYVYDAGGQRVRKVTERQAAAGQAPTRMKERIYLSGFEIYQEYGNDGATVTLERETLHIMDNQQRIALVELRTQGDDGSAVQLIRYQFGNHLGSAGLELDDQAQIISYEEYTPYGSTSYQAVHSQTEAYKRYRYTGMERDEENGFYYHGARYFSPWLARWTNCDPAGLVDGPNVYRYARANPVRFNDPNGQQPPDAANFATFQSFSEASPGPYSQEYLIGLWETTHGPTTPSAARSVTYSVARSEANAGAAAFRAQQGMVGSGPVVQAGHTVAARHVPESGISRAAANAPETFMPLTSRHGHGMSVEVTGHPNPLTPHAAQELVINSSVDRARAAGGGALTPEAHQASGAEVRWRLQGTGFDQREADIKRASGLFDEAASIEASPAVQARRAANAAPPPAAPPPPPAVPPPPGRLERATAWTARNAPKALRVLGQVFTVVGANEEAERTMAFERRHNRGELNAALMGTTTFLVGIVAGVADDAFAAAQIPVMGAPVLTMESWERKGSGPIQHAAGEAIRGLLGWGFSLGL